jgi:Fuc2NAc and GlcNAc transferase
MNVYVAELGWLALGCCGVAAALTWFMIRVAPRVGSIDRPSERSSHSVPTPRGGGLAIVVVSTLGVATLLWRELIDQRLALALLAGGTLVAIAGALDDLRLVSAVRVRLAFHVAAAVFAVAILGGLPPLAFGTRVVDLGWAGDLLAVVAVVWTLNLFNFMDGIDGIAGSEAIFVAGSGALLATIGAPWSGSAAAALLLAAACIGFLIWNWPPARIFMGDVGSGYLGFFLAVLALDTTRREAAGGFAWLILGGVFFVDTTVTVIRRMLQRARVYQAHRTHAYHWLTRRWNGHRPVTLLVIGIDVGWLLPWAYVATIRPSLAAWSVLAALGPLAIAALAVGAGRPETPTSVSPHRVQK